MADPKTAIPKKIAKPPNASTYRELSEMQEAFLYGVSQSFVSKNTEFINSVASKVQAITTRYNQNVASTSPQQLIDAVKANVSKRKLDAAQNDTTKQGFVTGVKGLTDLSKDMDLFRELVPLATPMFELFYEYQMVIGMIPEAAKCFDILKNAVLSADSFSKQYLIARYDQYKQNQDASLFTEASKKHVRLIKDIIEEYDLNIMCDQYITKAMEYGAKPVMCIPIDNTFRKSAEQVLRAESADSVRSIIKNTYDAGKQITMESSFEAAFESCEFSTGGLNKETAPSYISEFDNTIDNLIATYEDSFGYECSMFDDHDVTAIESANFKKNTDIRKEAIKKAKDKSKRKEVMLEMTKVVNKMVDSRVQFSLATESVSMRTVSKIAGQIKTYRRAQNYNTRGSRDHKEVTLENAVLYNDADPVSFENDLDLLCMMAENIRYEKHETKNPDGTTNESWAMITPDIYSYEDAINMKSNREYTKDPTNEFDVKSTVSNKTTGTVIVPLAPDTVVPIAVHGKHIGYYVIERLGSDDLGSGVATMLGYKPTNSMYSMGMAGHMYTGNGTMTGTDGAGVILRDMTDLPMNVRDDGQRIDLLRSMLVRAISERIGNPDIVDDTAFNSIIFSLIKDNYITKREVRITYVPAHMMVYFAHEIDQDSGIGTSVFQKGLFFAHIYVASLITNLMIAIAKSADREQVNVEVGSHGRIEATVQKVMRTLQTKRASVDSIGNIDTIMRTLGTFQRYISLRHNGQALVELETIPGQDVDLENSLMDKALKSFINSFYVPASAINQLDEMEYARSITLQNGLFLDKVVMLQLPYQECISKFVRILVRNKYPERIATKENIERVQNNAKNKEGDITDVQDLITLDKIFVDLPSPEGLNIASFNDQINNVSSFVDSLVDLLVPIGIQEDRVESVKTVIKRKMYEKYLTNLPFDEYDAIAEDAVVAIQQKKFEHPEVKEDDSYGGSASGGGGGSSSSFGSDSGGGGMDDFGDMGGGDIDAPTAPEEPGAGDDAAGGGDFNF